MTSNPAKLLVIGYGNEWRSDDALGPAVARRVESLAPPNVLVRTAHQLLPEFAAELATVEYAIFVDACYETEPLDPGSNAVMIARLSPHTDGSRATHFCHPSMLLGLAEVVFGHAPQAWLVSVRGERFEHGDSLSPRARERVEVVAHQITRLLHDSKNLSEIEGHQ
ncbi:hydrogenase maturation protease [Thalassoroseus pseudoceratinae]|uniref:hydrogenase maturation protease n=1 Tax=Thalassoroseus pseudoceratinae TaxID=2713176 RepID=UPI0014249552|nr:hydrogenase maturation protease [Thalassoroseus pseudoceratinae]